MHKFTHAIDLGNYIQALKDNGDVFLLSSDSEDDFGMLLDVRMLELIGGTKDKFINSLKDNSDTHLVFKLNSDPIHQIQVDKYEEFINPEKFKRDKELRELTSLYPQGTEIVLAAMERDGIIYARHHSGHVFILETNTMEDGSLDFTENFTKAFVEEDEAFIAGVSSNSDPDLVSKINSHPFFQRQLSVWVRHTNHSDRSPDDASFLLHYTNLLKFDIKFSDYTANYNHPPFLKDYSSLSPIQLKHENSLIYGLHDLWDNGKNHESWKLVTSEKMPILECFETLISSREDLRNTLVDCKVSALHRLHEVKKGARFPEYADKHLVALSKSLNKLAKRFDVMNKIPKKTLKLMKTYLSKNKSEPEFNPPL